MKSLINFKILEVKFIFSDFFNNNYKVIKKIVYPKPGVNLSCFLPFTLYLFWTRVRVKGNPYLVITRLLPGKVEGKVRVRSFHQHLKVIHFRF